MPAIAASNTLNPYVYLSAMLLLMALLARLVHAIV